ncbi:MAG: methylated-DNA--[protein]-cysteine S-methyltransferase [Acidimicrobiales bacterium]
MSPNSSPAIEHRLRALTITPSRGFLRRVVASWAIVPSPIGDVFVAWTEDGICAVDSYRAGSDPEHFVDQVRERLGRPVTRAGEVPSGLRAAARSGRATQLRFDLRGLTPFETDVLQATRRIPAGEIRPYAWVAAEIGRPKAVRAVGSALGRNPVPILIPCHRVTRSDGAVGNYGGGPAMKEELLRLEKVNLDEILELARHGVHFVGNTSTKVVCFPSCEGIRRSKHANRVGFHSVEDAAGAGYRPCGHCRPAISVSA